MSVPTFRRRHHPNVGMFTYHVKKKSNYKSSTKGIFKNPAVTVLSVLLLKVKNSIKKADGLRSKPDFGRMRISTLTVFH